MQAHRASTRIAPKEFRGLKRNSSNHIGGPTRSGLNIRALNIFVQPTSGLVESFFHLPRISCEATHVKVFQTFFFKFVFLYSVKKSNILAYNPLFSKYKPQKQVQCYQSVNFLTQQLSLQKKYHY